MLYYIFLRNVHNYVLPEISLSKRQVLNADAFSVYKFLVIWYRKSHHIRYQILTYKLLFYAQFILSCSPKHAGVLSDI